MKKEKMYFEEGNWENCYPLDYFRDDLGDDGVVLNEAVIDIGGDGAWCKVAGEAIERDDSGCGKDCDDYKPRNGKSGMCKHQTFCYTNTGKTFLLTKDGLREVKP